MKNWRGLWLADDEHHLPQLMAATGETNDGMPTYQLHKYQRVMTLVRPERRRAVDIGAHVGLWSRNMCLDFAAVDAFEPVEEYRLCWKANMRGRPHCTLHSIALGAKHQNVAMYARPGMTVDTHVVPGDDVIMRPLDRFGLIDVDLIKIDVEGYEVAVICGAERTIRDYKPAMVVEQKAGLATRYGFGPLAAVELLQTWGATLRCEMQGDYFLSWD